MENMSPPKQWTNSSHFLSSLSWVFWVRREKGKWCYVPIWVGGRGRDIYNSQIDLWSQLMGKKRCECITIDLFLQKVTWCLHATLQLKTLCHQVSEPKSADLALQGSGSGAIKLQHRCSGSGWSLDSETFSPCGVLGMSIVIKHLQLACASWLELELRGCLTEV